MLRKEQKKRKRKRDSKRKQLRKKLQMTKQLKKRWPQIKLLLRKRLRMMKPKTRK